MLERTVLIALLSTFGGVVMAQRPPARASDTLLQKCLLGTYPGTWSALHLSADQLGRMRLVQSACREECEKAGVHAVNNPISNANGTTVLAEVENILTVEQYAAWVAFCTEGSSNGKPTK